MLCAADSVGVFQVESRAQMATLPRLKPRTFYDLVVEVALIRPGPIQGGSVHPYIRRRNGQEPVTYLHPLLEPVAEQDARRPAVPGAAHADGDRRGRLQRGRGRPAASGDGLEALGRAHGARCAAGSTTGMAERGIIGEVADEIYDKLAAFANFGFPESHSVSFAYLVYASAWMKLHYPAAFLAALLNAQPMGFYSPRPSWATPAVTASRSAAPMSTSAPRRPRSSPLASCRSYAPSWCTTTTRTQRGRGPRYGSASSTCATSATISRRASPNGRPYASMEDLVRRTGVTLPAVEALATAGAFGCFGLERREALWAAGATAQASPDRLEGVVTGADAPTLPGMSEVELAAADLWATGLSPDRHPVQYVRAHLDALGAVPVSGLQQIAHGTRVLVGGVVTHRQRPATAQGTTFLNLEDETGLMNVICSQGVWARYRRVARAAQALLIRGRLERVEGVINFIAERIEPLTLSTTAIKSRDFR